MITISGWCTECLYGVSYSRDSPSLFAYVTSLVSMTDRTVSDVRVGRVMSCHRMAHYVLIRCFPQPSLAEALCLVQSSLVTVTDFL